MTIAINNAHEHNLKNLYLEIPKEKLVVIAGPSGSGKSSLLFDTIAAESAARLAKLERLSSKSGKHAARSSFMRPKVDSIENLPPVIAFETTSRPARKIPLGLFLGINTELTQLLISKGKSSCKKCNGTVLAFSETEIGQKFWLEISQTPDALWSICALLQADQDGSVGEISRSGFPGIIYKEQYYSLDNVPTLITKGQDFELVVDRLSYSDGETRFKNALAEALSFSSACASLRRISATGENYDHAWGKFSPQGVCQSCGSLGGALDYKLPVNNCLASFDELCDLNLELLSQALASVSSQQSPLLSKLNELCGLGLAHLNLNRSLDTLSGGELQRVRLSKQLLNKTRGFMYAIDEPCAGLHPSDSGRVLRALNAIRDGGNSIVVSENNIALIEKADLLITLGPGGGKAGGELVQPGSLMTKIHTKVVSANENLSKLTLQNVSLRNLKHITVEFPLGRFSCVTGVSGSGKSTLVFSALYPLLEKKLKRSGDPQTADINIDAGQCGGFEKLSFVRALTSRAEATLGSVATYLDISEKLEKFFAELPLSRMRGYKPSYFSLSSRKNKQHLCPACNGTGTRTVLAEWGMDEVCEKCHGLFFAPEILAVLLHGKSLGQLYKTTVCEASEILQPIASRTLELLKMLQLDYLTLGQPLNSLSRGELQRIRIIKELSARKKNGIYLFDEPSLGLSQAEIPALLNLFSEIIRQGNSIVTIEHNLTVISAAHHVIDMGPGAGDRGGEVVATGTPKEISQMRGSKTGEALASYFTNLGELSSC